MSRHHVVLPLSDTVLFPGQTLTLRLGPSSATQGLDQAYVSGAPVLLLATRTPHHSPQPSNLHTVGVLADVASLTREPDGTLQAQLVATGRAEMTSMVPLAYPCANVTLHPSALSGSADDLLPELQELARRHCRSGCRPALPAAGLQLVLQATSAAVAADLIAHHCAWPLPDKQRVLETLDPAERATLTMTLLQRDLDQYALDQRISDRVRQQQAQQQRDQYLREQLRAISQELHGDAHNELDELRQRLADIHLPERVQARATRELARLERTPSTSPEHGLLRTYLEWLAELPWQVNPGPPLDISHASQVLDHEHHGLNSVKERILDFLAVARLSAAVNADPHGQAKGTSLCLLGPPGVGKTSIAQSIARAMDRKFVRIALGGIKDEAEIRGHRRTYVGAMPGRIMQAIRSAGVTNPVVLLDEIDKVAGDGRSDVASALLEVLDPQQNRTFTDHYLEVEYDLSQVFFIATANASAPMSRPLLDRLEVVQLGGYTPAEKLAIARTHLVPRLLKRHALSDHLAFDDAGLERVIAEYTQEAGVRQLEQQLTHLLRKAARRYLNAPWTGQRTITAPEIPASLGPARYLPEALTAGSKAGLAHSLAWSTIGGSLLPVEAALTPGEGGLSLTGSLGPVLSEAAHAAVAHLRALGALYGLPPGQLNARHLYLHFPDTATPKDGASVGLAVVASVLSAYARQPLPNHLAMTGEVTLLGRVLPVAGIREKLLAAQQAGVHQVLLPEGNQPDVAALSPDQFSALDVTFVADIHDAFPHFGLPTGPHATSTGKDDR